MNNRDLATKQLFDAILAHDIKGVKQALFDGADINGAVKGLNGSPLFKAAYKGNMEIIKLLVATGADVQATITNASKEEFNSAGIVESAAEGNHPEVISYLLDRGANPNQARQDGSTALISAASKGYTTIVKILLARGANIDQFANEIISALRTTAVHHHSDTIKMLVAYLLEKFKNKPNDLLIFLNSNEQFKHAITHAQDYKVLSELMNLIDFLLESDINHADIKKLLPPEYDFKNTYFKENLLARIQSFPAKKRIALCSRILTEPNHPYRLIFSMQRGKNPCQLGHGVLLKVKTTMDTAIKKREAVNKVSKRYNNTSPLFYAAGKNDLALAKSLIHDGADCAKENTIQNPLYAAATTGNIDIINLLVNNGANPNLSLKTTKQAMWKQFNSQKGFLKDALTNFLLRFATNEVTITPGDYAAIFGYADAADLFTVLCDQAPVLAIAQPEAKAEAVVEAPVSAKKTEDDEELALAIKASLATEIPVEVVTTANSNNSIYAAATAIMHSDAAGADVNLGRSYDSGQIMFMARGGARCKLGHGMLKEIADLRDAAVIEFNTKEHNDKLNNELHDAARNCDLKKVTELIEKGADVNAETSKSLQKPLIIAAYEGKTDVVQLLLKHGANVNAVVTKGTTVQIGAGALLAAAENGHIDIAKILLAHGADMSAVTEKFNVTPLFRAAQCGYAELVSLLLSKGADIHATIYNHKTALSVTVKDDRGNATTTLLVNHLLSHDKPSDLLQHMQDHDQLKRCLREAKNASMAMRLMRIISHLLEHHIDLDVIKAMLPADKLLLEKHDADHVVAKALIQMFKNPQQFTAEKVHQLVSAKNDAELNSRAEAQLVQTEVKQVDVTPVVAKPAEIVSAPVVASVSAPVTKAPSLYPDLKNLDTNWQQLAAENNNVSAQMMSSPMNSVSNSITAQQNVFDLLFGVAASPAHLPAPLQPTPVVNKVPDASNEPFFSLKSLTGSPKISRNTALDAQMSELQKMFSDTTVYAAPAETPKEVNPVAAMTDKQAEDQLDNLESMFASSSPVLFKAPAPQQQTQQKNDKKTTHKKQAVAL